MLISRQSIRGFTLIELMIIITIAAILLGVGVPGMRDLMVSNRRTSVVNDLVSSLHLARSKAYSENIRVMVCPAAGAGTQCGGSTDWGNGWLVFRDDNPQNGSYDAAETLLLNQGAVPAGINLSANQSSWRFQRNRQPTLGTFTICPEGGGAGEGRTITIGTIAGYTRLDSADCP